MTSSNLTRWGGPAAILGGLLWIVAYGLEVLVGATTGAHLGEYDDPSGLNLIYLLLVHAGLLFLGVALLALRARLAGRSQGLSIAGAALAGLAIAMGVVNPVARTGLLAFLGILGVVIGSLLIGIATLRAGTLPRWARALPLLAGVLFFPLIFLTFPLESILPPYVVANFPFPIIGALWVATGSAMLVDQPADTARPTLAAA